MFWIKRADLPTHKLAEDFGEMVQVMESEELSEFSYELGDDGWRFRLL